MGEEHIHDHNGTLTGEHRHRAIIGFDKNGVAKVLIPADMHTHVDENGNVIEHTHEFDVTADYMKAVSAYRKTFPSKQDVIDQTPDPAVKEMILRAEQLGIDTAFDRFDAQKPQCSFGLTGTCCKTVITWCGRRCSSAWNACKRSNSFFKMGGTGTIGCTYYWGI